MPVVPITSLQEFKEKISRDQYVVIDFWAEWCGPCRQISPIFEKLSDIFTGVEFYKVNVDDQGGISQEVGIRAMPTFMLFKNGEKVQELVGANPQGLQVGHYVCRYALPSLT
ncbi:thioredoxin TrxA, partial [Amanita rubescens]